jgi:hypothetical protein
MLKCKNCGAEYDSAFLQCPQCGSSKHEDTEAPKENNLIGSLVSILVIFALLGIIGYGAYLLYNPITEGPTITDLPLDEFESTTTSTTTKTTSSTTTTINYNRTTTVPVSSNGTEVDAGDFKVTVPFGYSYTIGNIPQTVAPTQSATGVCITNKSNSNEQYCIGIQNSNISVNSSNEQQVNDMLSKSNYTNLMNQRLHGKLIYYALSNKPKISGYMEGFALTNKGSKSVVVGFIMMGSNLTEENTSVMMDIINTVK